MAALQESPEDAVVNLINLVNPNQISAETTHTNTEPQQNILTLLTKKTQPMEPTNNQQTSSSSSSSTSSSYPRLKKDQHRVDVTFGDANYRVPGLFTYVDRITIQNWERNWKQGLFITDIRIVKSIRTNQPPVCLSMKDLFRWFHFKVYSELLPVPNSLKRGRDDEQQQLVLEKSKYVKLISVLYFKKHCSHSFFHCLFFSLFFSLLFFVFFFVSEQHHHNRFLIHKHRRLFINATNSSTKK